MWKKSSVLAGLDSYSSAGFEALDQLEVICNLIPDVDESKEILEKVKVQKQY